MPSRQDTVNDPTIETVGEALFPYLERKVSPNYCHGRQQSPHENVRAKMHVMVAIESLRFCPIKTTELVALGGHEVFKRPDQQGVKKAPGKGVP